MFVEEYTADSSNGILYLLNSNPIFLNREERKPDTFSLRRINNVAVVLHLINAIIVFALCVTTFGDKPENIVYVSGKMQLTYTNYAVIDINQMNTCQDVKDYSSVYKDLTEKRQVNTTIIADIMPHHLYDFSNKTFIKYDVPTFHVYTYYLIGAFFLLSFVFQAFNGVFIGFEGFFPRIMHYLEYSISSSLMVIVLAVNTGILELYTVVAFFGLFFGMNILGACAELLSWVATAYKIQSLRWAWLLPHVSAWFLFLLAYVPIIISYEKNRQCSEAVPAFLTAAIYLEFIFFNAFGIAQSYLLFWRSTDRFPQRVDYWIDLSSILLSIVAKTFLAWVLLGPVLSVSGS